MQTAIIPPEPIPPPLHPHSQQQPKTTSHSSTPSPTSHHNSNTHGEHAAHPRPPFPHVSPSYPSLNYPSNSNPYAQSGPNGWMYSPQYFPQSIPHRQFPNGPNSGAGHNRFHGQENGYQPFPGHHQNAYYPPNFPQMGGPGPGTIQNGYGHGYQGDGISPYMRPNNFGHHPNGGYPTPPPTETSPQPPASQSNYSENGDNSVPSHTDAPPYQQHLPPPAIPPPGSLDGYPNQSYPDPHQAHPPYQPYYPPGHPYAYGGGFGYPQQQNGPALGYGNYNGYGDTLSSHISSVTRDSAGSNNSKGLNPAAAGFNFVPATQRQVAKDPTQVNGTIAPPKPTTPVFASIQQLPSHTSQTSTQIQTPLPNGHAEPKKWVPPVMVDGERLKGELEESTGVLGLQTDAFTVQQRENAPTQTTMTQTTSTPAMTTSPTTSTTPASVRTPRGPESSLVLSPKGSTSDGQWNFVGPTVSSYNSPPPTATNTRSLTHPPRNVPSSKNRSTYNDGSPLKLRASRPDVESTAENAYALSMGGTIPKSVKTEVTEGDTMQKPVRGVKGRDKASGKRVVFATGERVATNYGGSGLVFGSAIEQILAPAAAEPNTSIALEPKSEKIEVPVKVEPPKAKPASWAALLRPATTPSSSTAPSQAASPSISSVPFSPPASEAGPSRLPTSPLLKPTTPRSTAASLPPPLPSTGAASSGAPRPTFNYAAAAAAGAALSPQEELIKLLSEGIKGKAKEVPMTLPRGLINTGNMCFANTILQVLVYCPPFTELFEEMGKRLKADLARRTPLLEAMIIFLREFVTPHEVSISVSGTSTPRSEGGKWDPRREAFIPENVYDAMKENKRFDSMRRGYQEDAEEFLGFFLNTLHEEILYIVSRTQSSRSSSKASLPNGDSTPHERSIQRPVSPDASGDGDGWLEVGKKQKTNAVRNTETRESAVSRLFGGTLRSVLHIPGSKDSVTLEPYQPLQLDIQSSEVTSITDALKHLSASEIVPGVWSPSRGANVDATKQMYLETFPHVLILHLKRFVYDGKEMSVVKRSKPVAYGTELVIPQDIMSPARRSASPVKYKLFGVVYHHGISASGGHYTVSVARQDTKGWLHFDDESVSTVAVDQVVVSGDEAKEGKGVLVGGRERCAYLLFYQRVRA